MLPSPSFDLSPLLYVLVGVLYLVGARLIYLLREKHTPIWQKLGEPPVFAAWQVIQYCLSGEYKSLTDRNTRRVAQLEHMIIWCAVLAAIVHFVLIGFAAL